MPDEPSFYPERSTTFGNSFLRKLRFEVDKGIKNSPVEVGADANINSALSEVPSLLGVETFTRAAKKRLMVPAISRNGRGDPKAGASKTRAGLRRKACPMCDELGVGKVRPKVLLVPINPVSAELTDGRRAAFGVAEDLKPDDKKGLQ